jgi:tetratricopeptide (TPR) repeat protein
MAMTENTPTRANPFRLLTEAFRVIVLDDLASGVLNLKPLTPAVRWLGRAGLVLVAALIVLTLVFYAQRGALTRNWVDVPLTEIQAAGSDESSGPGVTSLALSFAGPIGLPPAALPICLSAISLGWGLALAGARRSRPWVYYPILLPYAAGLALMTEFLGNPLAWIALAVLVSLLAGLYWVYRDAPENWLWLEVLLSASLTGLFLGILVLVGGSTQWIPAGFVALQIIMLFILTGFWLLLGSDTIDAAVRVGRWLAGLITRGLSVQTARWLIPLLLVIKIALTVLFAPPLIADVVVTGLLLVGLLVILLRGRYDEGTVIITTTLAVISTVVIYYATLGISGSALVETALFAIPPVFSFAFFVVWDMLGKGADFVDNDTLHLSRPARLFLLLGWVTLAATTMLFFFAARDDAFEAFAVRVSAEAVLVSGLPFALYLLINKAPTLIHAGDQEVEGPNRLPGWTFVLLAIAIAVGLSLTEGLTTVQFAQSAVLTNRADLIAETQPKEAERLYKAALEANPGYYKGNFNLGTFYYGQGRYEEAVPQFRAAISANEEYVQAYVNLGVALSSADRPEEAEQVYLDALELDDRLSYAYNNLGLIYMHRGEWERAESYLNRALEYATEERVEFYNNLGQAEWEVGKWQQAEAHLLRAVELAPDRPDYYITLGLMYNSWGTEALFQGEQNLANERYQKSREAYEKALDMDADTFLIGTNLSQLYLDVGELEKAEALLRQTLVDYPDDANLYNILGIILYQGGRLDEARIAFQTAKEKDPAYPYAWAGEALIDLQRKDYATARDGYLEALRLGLDRDYVRHNLGLCYLELNQPEQALEQFDAVIAMETHQADAARRQRAIALVYLGRDEEALALWDEVGAEADASEYVGMGQAYYFRGDLEQAEAYYRQATEADPNDPSGYTELGLVMEDLGRVEEAIALHQQAIEADPTAPEPYVNLASALIAQGDIEGAEDAYRRAIEADPNLPEGHVGLGEILSYKGDSAGARAEFETALALDPNQPIANFKLGLIYYYEEDYQTAIAYFEIAIAAHPAYVNPYAFLGLAHATLGNTEEAIAAFEAGLAVCTDPEQCDLLEEALGYLRD